MKVLQVVVISKLLLQNYTNILEYEAFNVVATKQLCYIRKTYGSSFWKIQYNIEIEKKNKIVLALKIVSSLILTSILTKKYQSQIEQNRKERQMKSFTTGKEIEP